MFGKVLLNFGTSEILGLFALLKLISFISYFCYLVKLFIKKILFVIAVEKLL